MNDNSLMAFVLGMLAFFWVSMISYWMYTTNECKVAYSTSGKTVAEINELCK
jgi:hypothetical protein